MGTEKKFTAAPAQPSPTPPSEEGTPFKGYSTPGTAGSSTDDDD